MDFHFRFTGFLEISLAADAVGFAPGEDGSRPDRQNLKLLARLVPLDSNRPPTYLRRQIGIRSEAIRHGRVRVGFRYYLGLGSYRIDWMAETDSGRICAESHRMRARLGRGEREIRPSLEPGQSYFSGQSAPIPWWVIDRRPPGFNLKLILNIPPFKERRPLIQADLSRIEGILTAVALHPTVGRVSLVVFNMKDQRVLYRQESETGYPNPGELAEAIRSLSNSQVRVETLKEDSEVDFLRRLLIGELSSTKDFDAVVLIGPRSPLSLEVSRFLDEIQDAAPLYYLKYRFFEAGAGWSDPLQRLTQRLGGKVFPIQSPRDLWRSVEALMQKIGEEP